MDAPKLPQKLLELETLWEDGGSPGASTHLGKQLAEGGASSAADLSPPSVWDEKGWDTFLLGVSLTFIRYDIGMQNPKR